MKFTIKLLLILLVLLINQYAEAQKIHGIVYELSENNQKQMLSFAKISWASTQLSTITDDNGRFSIQKPDSNHLKLVIGFVGFKTDTISVLPDQDSVIVVLTLNKLLK